MSDVTEPEKSKASPVHSALSYQPANAKPLFVGFFAGYTNATVSVTVCATMLPLPPIKLKVTV